MSRNTYSGLKDIPRGNAPEQLTEGCLVLEGGAFRGVYTNGVIDALMQEGLCFRTTYGVSAGAMNGINYVAGQIGRSARVNLRYRKDSRYVGKEALRANGGIIGFDFVFGDLEGIEKLNEERLMSRDTEFFPVATCMETGEAVAFEKGDDIDRLFKAVQASASMPFVSRAVEIDGRHYLDGGCACKIPYRFALEREFEKVIVVRTRPRSYRKPMKPSRRLTAGSVVYKAYPEFIEQLERSDYSYNLQCDELQLLEARKRIFVIAPSKPVTVSRLEGDLEKLGELYQLGYNDTRNRISELREYLEG